MKTSKRFTVLAIAALAISSCQKEKFSAPEAEVENAVEMKNANVGQVYTLSNQVAGNEVIAYHRGGDGSLTWAANYPTGGTGTGGGLGNQGAVILDDGILLAVNAGSHSISSFWASSQGLVHRSTVSSGGMMPVSITRSGNLVFALNAGGDGNISGFTLDGMGMLHPIAGSTRPLSASGVGPAQVEFVNGGSVLAITEKGSNKITTYTVDGSGMPGMMHTLTAANTTPFGFAAGRNGHIFVSEAAMGAPGASTLSSYHIAMDGSITLVDGPVGAGQTAACWVVLTNNGKYAYTTNTASNNISNYGVNNAGDVMVKEAIAATTGMGPIDAALSNNSKFLYVLNAGSHIIDAFAVGNDGSLSHVQTTMGIPAGATGMAAK